MSTLKQKIVNAFTAHPKLVTFGIGLAITFVVGTAIGMVDHQQAFALGNAHGRGGDSNASNGIL